MATNTTDALLHSISAGIEAIRAGIDPAIKAGAAGACQAASAELAKLRESTASAMVAELNKAAKSLADQVVTLRKAQSRPAVVRAVWISALSAVVLFGAGAGVGYFFGARERLARVRVDTALTRWVLTPAGRAAYALDRANSANGGVRELANCAGFGWHEERNGYTDECWGYSSTGGGHPWLLSRR